MRRRIFRRANCRAARASSSRNRRSTVSRSRARRRRRCGSGSATGRRPRAASTAVAPADAASFAFWPARSGEARDALEPSIGHCLALACVAPLHCSAASSRSQRACAAAAEASKFPNRPIQLIVPYAAGGAVDQTARFLQQGMEKRLGQNVLVINRPGASTTLGTCRWRARRPTATPS